MLHATLVYSDGSRQMVDVGGWVAAWMVARFWQEVFGVEVVGIVIPRFPC